MRFRLFRISLRLAAIFPVACFGIGFLATGVGFAADEIPAAHVQFFENEVRPLLAEKCFPCHGPDQQKGELRLDSRAAMLSGGESGEAILPGKPEQSMLIEAIRGTNACTGGYEADAVATGLPGRDRTSAHARGGRRLHR